jgi:amino acid adenylation domain-containing protein/FkbM family methyltransferase
MANATSAVSELSPEQLSAIAQRLQRDARRSVIPRRKPAQHELLSSAQQRLWFIHRLLPDIPLYQVPVLVPFQTEVDCEIIRACLVELTARHETLRTTFAEIAGSPMQVVHSALPIDFRVVDLSHLPETAKQAAWIRAASEQTRQPFDLSHGPLMRSVMFRLSCDCNVLLIVMHHIISDGWSVTILAYELKRLYAARSGNGIPGLPELPIQYADFAVWQRRLLAEGQWDGQIAYWKRHLAELPPSPLPGAPQYPMYPSYRGAISSFSLPATVADGLRALSRREGTTLFMTVLAAFKVLLSRHSGLTDVVVGSPIAGRTRPELEPLIGCFVNPLVFRTDVSGNPDFIRLLQRVKEVTLSAYANQDVPFERLVEELQPDRGLMRNPLFQVAFSLQNASADIDPFVKDLADPATGTAKFDLCLVITETPAGLAGSWEYDTDLFEETDIHRLTASFKTLLAGIAARPSRRILELPLLPPEDERSLMLWNSAEIQYRQDRCVHHLFELSADRWRTRIAVKCGNESLQYGELNRRANCVADALRDAGVSRGSLVGISCRQSVDLIVAMLAVLKAGGAYVPIDPDYPADRLALMLGDMQAAILLTQKSLADRFAAFGCDPILVDAPISGHRQSRPVDPCFEAGQDDLAYAIYTSGSTGRPKLTGVRHGGFINLLSWYIKELAIAEADRNLVTTSSSFDLTQKNLLAPLLVGAEVHLIASGEFDPRSVVATIGAERITLLNCTPSMFYVLADAPDHALVSMAPLRYVLLGGEPIDTRRLQTLARSPHFRAEIMNTYGPTECTDVVAFYRLPDLGPGSRIPIGRPIDNVHLHVLDERLGRVPIGAPGELCISGIAVGAGYLNDATLTGQRFVPDPYSPESGRRLYLTGDRARYLSDGNIEFLGRSDQQIKLRGFRIEPGEIEAVLREHPGVDEAVVSTAGPSGGQLVAFVVPDTHRAGPVANLLRMQRQGMLSGYSTTELPNGMSVVHRNRSETEFVYREMFEEHSYLRHGIMLRPDAVVFDVGANIGLFALYVTRLQPTARIYAFEPIPPVFAALCLNMQAYDVKAKLFQIGLSGKSEMAEFHHYPHVSILSSRHADHDEDSATVRSFLRAQAESGEAPNLSEENVTELLDERLRSERYTCALRTLSEIIHEEAVSEIDLLKIDVEKSELEVLEGVHQADWDRIRQVVVEVHDIDGRLARIVRLLERRGFSVHVDQDHVLQTNALFNVYARRAVDAVAATSAERKRPACGTEGRKTAENWSSPELLRRDLRTFAKSRLPDHMVPAHFLLLDGFPTTPSGKLDLKALTKIADDTIENRTELVPPRTDLERKIAAIWSEVLALGRLSVFDNFFELGGHSLSATQVVARLRDEFRVAIPLRRIFESPTIESLSKALVEEMVMSSGAE